MSRFLDVNQKAFLDDNATIYETLVKITIGADSVYYTTGSIDVTPTVGADTAGLTFVANNMIKSIDDIPEKTLGTSIRVGMVLTGDFTQNLGALGVTPFNLPNIDTAVTLWRGYRNVSGNDFWVYSSIKLFQGVLTKKTYSAGNTFNEMQLEFISKTQFAKKTSPITVLKGRGAR